MIVPTGWAGVDNSIQLDGRPLTGLPSSHLTTIIDDDNGSLADELFKQIDREDKEGFSLWVDLFCQRKPTNSDRLVVSHWSGYNAEPLQMLGLVYDVLEATSADSVVVESAYAIGGYREIGRCLRAIVKCCVMFDAVGIFFSNESYDPSTGNTYWLGEKPIRDYSSYIIGPNREIVWSSVMPPKDGAVWKLA